MKEVLKNLSAVLLIALLMVKASAFHIYDHNDALSEQENHCEFCLLVMDSQQSDILVFSTDILRDSFLENIHEGKIASTDCQVHLNPWNSALLTRPPPTTA